MKAIFIISWILFSCTFFSQGKKFKNKLDTIKVTENQYILNYDYKSFFSVGELNDEIDFMDVNQELIDACLFFTINKLRKKYHRPLLAHNLDLYKVASAYTQTNYSSNFENDKKDKSRVNKSVKYFTKKEEFHAGQLKTVINTQKLMDLKGVYNFYYDKSSVEEDEDDWGIVKGNFKDRYDSTKTKEYIEPLTYLELSNKLTKQFSSRFRRNLRNKAFSEGSCSVSLDPRTVFKKKIPTVKLIFIFAGKRTALVEDLEQEGISIYPEE